MPSQVIAIDDDELFLTAIATLFREKGVALKTFSDPEKAYAYIDKYRATAPIAMAIVDLVMPTTGDQVIAHIKKDHPQIHTVILSSEESEQAIQICRSAGADHFYKKDGSKETILLLAEIARRKSADQTPVQEHIQNQEKISSVLNIEGCSNALARVADLVTRFAVAEENVLISGPSGVGKEQVAQALHRHSPRAMGPFIAINCAAIPKDIIESEIFGHSRGAFTGACQARKGKFEAATGGTLFLDEIGDMDLSLQAKILRAIQQKEVTPLGSNYSRSVNVRVISATNQNLSNEINNGNFRADLFYRLHILPIHVPPLEDRREDIIPIVQSILKKKNAQIGANKIITNEALDWLKQAVWNGNVRELIGTVIKGYILADDEITLPLLTTA